MKSYYEKLWFHQALPPGFTTEFLSPAELAEDKRPADYGEYSFGRLIAFKQNTRGVYLGTPLLDLNEGVTFAAQTRRQWGNGGATEVELGKHEVGPAVGFDVFDGSIRPRIADQYAVNGTRVLSHIQLASARPLLLFQLTVIGRSVQAVVLDLHNSQVVFNEIIDPDWYALEPHYAAMHFNFVTTANELTTAESPVMQAIDWVSITPPVPFHVTSRLVADLGWR